MTEPGRYDYIYERIERFADRGVIQDANLESAKVEAIGAVASELARIRTLLETVIGEGFLQIDAGDLAGDRRDR